MSATVAHLERLAAFPTISRDSNLDLIAYVEDVLSRHGVTATRVASEDGRKANLWATIGPADRPGVVLSGHTDVVPVEGQAWTSDPFALTRRGDRLVARGSADMKGFIAACLAMVPSALGKPLSQPIHLAFSYDEEVGCLGVRRLIDMLREIAPKPRLVIIGEPTSLQVVTAHKGKRGMRVTAHGLEAHSGLAPMGVNANYMAMDLVSEIRTIQREIAERGLRDGDYAVPYTTLHVGRFAGGESLNIVPNRAVFDFEVRYLPADDPQPMLERIARAADRIASAARTLHPAARFDFEPLASYPAMDTPPDSEAVALVRALTRGNSLGKISFGTEGGLFSRDLGLPVVICGPGSIAVAHKPDEYITRDQLYQCDAMLARLVERLQA
jgi:acetylornithine deacetylase